MPSKRWASWDYTVFAEDGTEQGLEYWIERLADLTCNAHVASVEICPETGTPHLQGRIVFKRTYTFKAMQKILGERPHIEGTKCPLDDNYCRKVESERAINIDNRKKKGERTDLDNMRDLVKETNSMRQVVDVARSYQSVRMCEKWLEYNEPKREIDPNGIKVHWRWGPSGCGKTKYVWDMYPKEEVYTPTTYKWWQGYDGHKVVLIDELRANWCTFGQLLKLLDIYPYTVETKGGSRQIQATTWYITSAYPPEKLYNPEHFDAEERVEQLTRRITTVTLVQKRTREMLDSWFPFGAPLCK